MADVYELAEKFRQQAVARERAAAARLVREYGKVYVRIQAEVRALLAEAETARKRGEVVDAAWVYQYNRLRRLQAQTEAQISTFADAAGTGIEAAQLESALAGQRDAAALMRTALGVRESGVHVAFNVLPRAALNEMIGFTDAGTPLGKLLAELGPDAARRVSDTLVQNLALGRNPRQTARDIRESLGGSLSRALTISRTETLRAYREGTRAAYAENSDIISGWRWLSARQARTCAACWAMDGQVFETTKPMPAHPNCRCVMLPVIVGKTDKAGTGADAFASLGEAGQRQVLGKDYDAWKRGEVTLQDFVRVRKSPVWGETVGAGRAIPGNTVKLPGSVAAKPAKPAPPPLPEVGKFQTLDEAAEWGRVNYPKITFGFDGTHIDTINPTLKQFHTLAQQYPDVADTIKYIGTDPPIYGKAYWSKRNAIAYASQHGYIGLNPKYYGDPIGFKKGLEYSVNSGFNPIGCDTYESVMTHEFGHVLHNFLLSRNTAFNQYVTAEGFGIVGDTTRKFMDILKRQRKVSDYARENEKETWAENFAAIYHTPKDKWIKSTKTLDDFLGFIFSSSSYPTYTFISDLPFAQRAIERVALFNLLKPFGFKP